MTASNPDQGTRQLVERQQAQLDAQQQQLTTQRAELDALKGPAAAPPPSPAPVVVDADRQRIDELERSASQTKVAAQEAPVVRMTANRPTIPNADGRSSIAVRGNVQMDMANYDQAPAGPLASDYRRGSVGAVGARETDAARDLSDGAYFRRARIGVEGVIARDFTYRFLAEFGGAGAKGPRVSTMPTLLTPVSRRLLSSSVRSRRLQTSPTAPRPRICCSSNARHPQSCPARSEGPMAVSVLACASAGRNGLEH